MTSTALALAQQSNVRVVENTSNALDYSPTDISDSFNDTVNGIFNSFNSNNYSYNTSTSVTYIDTKSAEIADAAMQRMGEVSSEALDCMQEIASQAIQSAQADRRQIFKFMQASREDSLAREIRQLESARQPWLIAKGLTKEKAVKALSKRMVEDITESIDTLRHRLDIESAGRRTLEQQEHLRITSRIKHIKDTQDNLDEIILAIDAGIRKISEDKERGNQAAGMFLVALAVCGVAGAMAPELSALPFCLLLLSAIHLVYKARPSDDENLVNLKVKKCWMGIFKSALSKLETHPNTTLRRAVLSELATGFSFNRSKLTAILPNLPISSHTNDTNLDLLNNDAELPPSDFVKKYDIVSVNSV